ncbi:MAG: hypothetical protein WC149_11035 [Arcobacteraceae bacterium]
MKHLIVILSFISVAFCNQYTFLVNKYDKEIELEAKIILKIATSSLNKKDVALYIPEISQSEKEIYSKFFTLTNSCDKANFVFVKKTIDLTVECQEQEKLFFTNNYQKLMLDKRYFGAFFWNKSRPNMVFIKNRIERQKVELPHEYEQFVEDF